ncbi:hypothetical protein CDAR_285851 [Caerostris darwini]|uniref:Uncharacterized protein n=1 Tax=Caerostris darwini TaxID=1538125 RepID=A0AAV4U0E6_9ARAC|nr:hypothetical protein CDAR_285851 [Caerostris darwini]
MGAKYNRHDFDLYVQMEWFGLDWMGWLGDWDIYGIYFMEDCFVHCMLTPNARVLHCEALVGRNKLECDPIQL